MTMKDIMQAEQEQAIATVEEANALLYKLFGIADEDE